MRVSWKVRVRTRKYRIRVIFQKSCVFDFNTTEEVQPKIEFGFEIGIPITVDSNNIAIDDALAAYPGEYTYEDFYCAVQVTKGRGA